MAVHALYVAHKVVQIVQEGRGKAQGVENRIKEAGVAQVDQGGNGRGQIRRGGARRKEIRYENSMFHSDSFPFDYQNLNQNICFFYFQVLQHIKKNYTL